ncbi:MAG TPA: hypothetical protein VNP90_10600 [Actinomycetota bacterium]|nr:hypothetical protein [Actinomycetota bacterium]
MPDVRPTIREVYVMVTTQRPPDPGALERQRTRQIRTMRTRKIGAFAVAAAIGVAAVAVILASRPRDDTTETGTPRKATPVEVATGFVEAYGALDAERTISYLADDAEVASIIGWVGAQGGEGPLDEFRLVFSLLDAQGYSHTLDSCEERGRSGPVTNLRCSYDLHWLRSDEIGLGPFSENYLDLIVRGEEIAHVDIHLDNRKVGRQIWEPFARWVSRNHPEDVAVMYQDETQSLERVTEESIRLWDRYTRDYVEDVNQSDAGQ